VTKTAAAVDPFAGQDVPPELSPVKEAQAPAKPANTLSLDDTASPDEPALEPFAKSDAIPDQNKLIASLSEAQSKLGAKR
jgi:hypothetical protein